MADNSQIKVSIGMSSSVVSAYLLQQQGYQVEGLFMKNWEEDDMCGSPGPSGCAGSL